MKMLTIRQAFDVMVCFLEDYYQRGKSDEIGALLGGLNIHLWADGMTADPALWGDWMKCVQRMLMPETPENRELFVQMVANQANYLGTDSYGTEWYAQLLPDGRQLWAHIRGGEIGYGGIRTTPKAFDPKTGLSSPSSP